MAETKTKKKKSAKKSWWQRIDEAEKRGSFDRSDKEDASNWPDCACGEQSKFIPRVTSEEDTWHLDRDRFAPKDDKLFDLGVSFSEAVDENEFKRARNILTKIEMRSSQLLTKILKEAEEIVKNIKPLLSNRK